MSTKTLRLAAALFVVAATSSAGSALAASQTSELNVRLEIQSGCTANLLEGATLDFGQVAGTPTNDIQRSARVSVSCSGYKPATGPAAVAPTLGLGYGLHADGNQRNVQSGTNKVPYSLYKNGYYGDAWGLAGTGSGGPLTINNLTNDTPQEVTIYGVVKKSDITSKPVGVYTDTVQIVLTY
ncbi:MULTISPECIES: spore coat protein U domain-containing protein [unclassified Phyllobacterium]|uniref:Csu type fimbrial protein n=1 Tax=unclassified Phyllobacterium TaxID=2638441 RepID=UPI000481E1E3|nr:MULTISPECIES: spore coat protein U domain-containing protein [unclassified Phyllobacterium]SFI94765.1 Spore coat protein U (SCPU) domain-containing protein [Phyllobacterium sp. CL33Tsu]